MFGTTELIHGTSQQQEVDAKLALVRALLERRGLDAVVLSGADAVAWVTGGITSPIERGVPVSPLWLVVRNDSVVAVTTNVERPRIEAEAGLDSLEIPVHEAPWHESLSLERAALELAGAPRARIGGLGADVADDLVEMRLALLPSERARIATLALDATAALEEGLRTWVPGERDFDVQARVSERLERVGAFGACLIVGGDDRVERFRHPLAAGGAMARPGVG